jgi:hypothetical protein
MQLVEFIQKVILPYFSQYIVIFIYYIPLLQVLGGFQDPINKKMDKKLKTWLTVVSIIVIVLWGIIFLVILRKYVNSTVVNYLKRFYKEYILLIISFFLPFIVSILYLTNSYYNKHVQRFLLTLILFQTYIYITLVMIYLIYNIKNNGGNYQCDFF